jgi:hypothetical protein
VCGINFLVILVKILKICGDLRRFAAFSGFVFRIGSGVLSPFCVCNACFIDDGESFL